MEVFTHKNVCNIPTLSRRSGQSSNIVEQILMIVFIQLFHIEKGIEKCLLFMNFFLSNKKAIVYLQITQIKTITAFPTSFFLADRVILSCLFLGNYCAFK